MPLDKALQTSWNICPAPITAVLQFAGDILGDIAGPAFRGMEADDPNWIGILSLEQVRDDGLKVCGGLEVGLSPATAEVTKIIEHQIDCFTVATRDKEGVQLPIRNSPSPIAKR
jgi:hypothetical protein